MPSEYLTYRAIIPHHWSHEHASTGHLVNPDHSMTTLPAVERATAVMAVLLSSRGESDDWESEVFEALCRTHSHTHLHFILPPPTNLSVQLCNSMSAAFGAFTGVLPVYTSEDSVVEKLANHLASSGRGWSWAESPSLLMKASSAKSKPRSVLGSRRRPLYGLWLRALNYQPI